MTTASNVRANTFNRALTVARKAENLVWYFKENYGDDDPRTKAANQAFIAAQETVEACK